MEKTLIEVYQSKNIDSLVEIIEDFCLQNNFTNYAYTALSHDETIKLSNYFYNYPKEWAEYYLAHHFQKYDPILKLSKENSLPFQWHEEISKLNLSKHETEVLHKAKVHKIDNGITIPINNFVQNVSLTFLFEEHPTQLQTFSLISLAQVIHHKINNFELNLAQLSKNKKLLTQREIECLIWCAKGKTNAEIAMILQVSENTVKFHLKGMMSKLNVTNKVHAVLKSLLLQELNFSEII